MESEYVAASKCVNSIRFLHKLMKFLDLSRQGPTATLEDNSACIAISTKTVHKSRSKHIGTKYHSVREACQNGEVTLVQVWTKHQISDIFTKSLPPTDFVKFREVLMGRVTFDDMVKANPNPDKATILNVKSASSQNYKYQLNKLPSQDIQSIKKIWPSRSMSDDDHWISDLPGTHCMSWRQSIMGGNSYSYPGHAY